MPCLQLRRSYSATLQAANVLPSLRRATLAATAEALSHPDEVSPLPMPCSSTHLRHRVPWSTALGRQVTLVPGVHKARSVLPASM